MHIPDFVIERIQATVPRTVTVTTPKGVSVAVTHHDVGSQLGQECTNEFYGYDETIELRGSGSIFKRKR